MNKKITIGMAAAISILAMTVTFSITMVVAMRLFEATVASVSEKESMYSKFSELDKYVRENAFYSIDEATLNDTIGSGYMLGLGDANARYYTASAYAELQKIENGTLMGIGCAVAKDPASGYAIVVRVYSGSPAADLGIARGYYITSINGINTKTLPSTEAINRALRGEAGTTAEIGYITDAMEEKTASINRRSYTVDTVQVYILEEEIGYIKIFDFTAATETALSNAVDRVKASEVKGVVIDLRDTASNDWGSMVRCADLLCSSGVAGYRVDKNGKETELLAFGKQAGVTFPVVCLVNGGTGGAAEGFAAALQANCGAKVAGTNTAGHGTIQSSPYKMSDGSALVLTTAKVLMPDKTSFEETGIKVELIHELTADEQLGYYTFSLENDPQIKYAVTVAVHMAKDDANGGGNASGQPNSGDSSSSNSEDTASSDSTGADSDSDSTSGADSDSDSASGADEDAGSASSASKQ